MVLSQIYFIFRNISVEEWEHFTRENIMRGAKEINSARTMRSYIDTLLTQVTEDLTEQANCVNEAFRRRIEETKEAKTKLEVQHSEVSSLFLSSRKMHFIF